MANDALDIAYAGDVGEQRRTTLTGVDFTQVTAMVAYARRVGDYDVSLGAVALEDVTTKSATAVIDLGGGGGFLASMQLRAGEQRNFSVQCVATIAGNQVTFPPDILPVRAAASV